MMDRSRIMLGAGSLALAASLLVSSAVAGESPELYIESIRFDGLKRATREILLTEAQLEEGRSYREAELRDAIHRLRRLAFILDVTMSLERGTERGRYLLAIQVQEVAPLFLGLDLDVTYTRFDVGPGPAYTDRLVGGFATVGYRHFLGTKGLLFVSLPAYYSEEDSPNLVAGEIGYTWFGIFGTSSVLTTSVQTDLDVHTIGLEAEIPLVRRHSIHLLGQYTDDSQQELFAYRSWSGGLSWRFDTRDDSILPTQGLFTSTTLRYWKWTHETKRFMETRTDTDVVEGNIQIDYYRPITGTVSWRVGGDMSISSFGGDLGGTRRETGQIEAGHVQTLWAPRRAEGFRELRWETRLFYSGTRWSIAGAPAFIYGLETGLAFRNRWGLFQVGITYSTWESNP